MIDGKVELGMEQGNAGRRRELNTRDFTIRIANKGQLTVDNPDLYFMGNKEIMTVESGGDCLCLRAGHMKACIPITSWSKREENTRFPPVFSGGRNQR